MKEVYVLYMYDKVLNYCDIFIVANVKLDWYVGVSDSYWLIPPAIGVWS